MYTKFGGECHTWVACLKDINFQSFWSLHQQPWVTFFVLTPTEAGKLIQTIWVLESDTHLCG